jgi:N-dimethylarginine dimethylaminohydrolase
MGIGGAKILRSRHFNHLSKEQVNALDDAFSYNSKGEGKDYNFKHAQAADRELLNQIVPFLKTHVDKEGYAFILQEGVAGVIDTYRARKGLAPLTPEQKNLIGQEKVFSEYIQATFAGSAYDIRGLIAEAKICTPQQITVLDSAFCLNSKKGFAGELFSRFVQTAKLEVDKNGVMRFSPKDMIGLVNAFREEKGLPLLTQEQKGLLSQNRIFDSYMQYTYGIKTGTAFIPAQKPATDQKFYMVSPEEMQTIHDGEIAGSAYLRKFADSRMKWEAYRLALEASGAEVIAVRGGAEAGSRHETWSRDFGVKIGDTYYLPDATMNLNEGYADIGQDAEQFKTVFKGQPPKMQQLTGAFFEGGNIIVDERTKTIIVGYDEQYNTPESLQNFIDQVNATQDSHYEMIVAPLMYNKRQDAYGGAYHLDLAMSEPLPNGEILIHPESIAKEAYDKIKQVFGDRLIEIDAVSAKRYATNLVSSGNMIIMMESSLRAELEKRGYEVCVPMPVRNNDLEKGGIHCLTQPLPSAKIGGGFNN